MNFTEKAIEALTIKINHKFKSHTMTCDTDLLEAISSTFSMRD